MLTCSAGDVNIFQVSTSPLTYIFEIIVKNLSIFEIIVKNLSIFEIIFKNLSIQCNLWNRGMRDTGKISDAPIVEIPRFWISVWYCVKITIFLIHIQWSSLISNCLISKIRLLASFFSARSKGIGIYV